MGPAERASAQARTNTEKWHSFHCPRSHPHHRTHDELQPDDGGIHCHSGRLLYRTHKKKLAHLLQNPAQNPGNGCAKRCDCGRGLRGCRDHRGGGQPDRHRAPFFVSRGLPFTGNPAAGPGSGCFYLPASWNGIARYRILYRAGHPCRAGTFRPGHPTPYGPHDCLLVQPGREYHPPCCPGIFCGIGHCRIESHADGIYFLETGQGNLYHSRHHGLSSAPPERPYR